MEETYDSRVHQRSEWGRRLGISKDRHTRRRASGRSPAASPIGRLYRVNWSAFVQRSGLGAVATSLPMNSAASRSRPSTM